MIHLALLLAVQQPQPSQPIERLVVTPTVRTVAAGDSVRLRAQAFDASGREMPNVRYRYVQAGAGFEGALDSTGLFTAGAPGKFPISVVAILPGMRPKIETITMMMVAGAARRIALSPMVGVLVPGQGVLVRAHVYSAAGDERSGDRMTWRSSAPSVARVDEKGILTALAPGRATITARVGAAAQTMDVRVSGERIASIVVTPSAREGRTGDVLRMRAVARDAGGKEITGLTPTWSITPGRGEIDADGAFVGYEPAQYEVTARFGSQAGSTAITVSPRDARRPAQVVGKVVVSAFPTSEVWIHPNGKVAYLGTDFGGDRVYAIDISNPAAPVIVDSITVSARNINDIMTTPDGNYMVITREGSETRKNGIVIADTRDPLHPKFLTEFTNDVTAGVHSAFIHQQARYGTHVYLTNDGTGMVHIVDITDPANPREVSRWAPRAGSAGRTLHDVDVQDGLLYGSWWNDGLVILDVGNGIKGGTPSSPKLVSQLKYDLDAQYRDLERELGTGFIRGTHTAWRSRNYVFIADEVFGLVDLNRLTSGQASRAFGKLHVVDVTDIEKPRIVAWYEPELGGVHNVWVAGDTLYLGAYNGGFHAFDVSGELRGDLRAQGREIASFVPADPKAKVPNAAMTWGVVVNPKDGLAYVNDLNSGMWIVRLTPKPAVVP